jgi:hypothetical protein
MVRSPWRGQVMASGVRVHGDLTMLGGAELF